MQEFPSHIKKRFYFICLAFWTNDYVLNLLFTCIEHQPTQPIFTKTSLRARKSTQEGEICFLDHWLNFLYHPLSFWLLGSHHSYHRLKDCRYIQSNQSGFHYSHLPCVFNLYLKILTMFLCFLPSWQQSIHPNQWMSQR